MFHANLAHELTKVGYQIEREKHNFQVVGFDRSLVKKFSKRTEQVNAIAKKKGIESNEDKSAIAARNRANKRDGYKLDELKMQWRSRLSEKEKLVIDSAKGEAFNDSTSASNMDKEAAKAIDYSLEHNFERKSVASKKEVLMHALKRGIGKVNFISITEAFTKHSEVIEGKNKYNESVYTTKEALSEEKKLINETRAGKNTQTPLDPEYRIGNDKLTEEQSVAVNHVLSSRDFITILGGKAGTG